MPDRNKKVRPKNPGRRKFIKHCLMGGCGFALGCYTIQDLLQGPKAGLRVGFRGDGPEELWKWSRQADWYEATSPMVHCTLCPHECLLGENDRGFCRVRVVKDHKLISLAYGNPCAIHVDPIEKKPLAHFLPGTPIFSLATAGCNLRCRNCQNWEISQSKPEQTQNHDLFPKSVVEYTVRQKIPSIAYTYSEPLIFYEYVKDTAQLAHQNNTRNVLVTAGYINPQPLKELCQVIDAANVDLKAFNDGFYKKVTQSTLAPVLRTLEIMRELGVWVEVTRLIVPGLSDDMKDIRLMAKWIAKTLGPYTPLHLSRFHPAYKLRLVPPTPYGTMEQARLIALEEGLDYVYVGNLPTHDAQDTICPHCHRHVIERSGYEILKNRLQKGHCPCGKAIPGVWG